jgi:ferredoxin/flavodoxin---NADP+ reductase
MLTCATDDARERLRTQYNATVVQVRDVHAALRIIRARPDGRRLTFEPGQYTTLALGTWEPYVEQPRVNAPLKSQLIRRAYSISCSMLDNEGRLVRSGNSDYLEFYVALVAGSDAPRPKLTPRLFALRPGARLYVSRHVHGRYTLARVGAIEQVVFVATGTGEAPHNAMLAELLASGHSQPIVSVTCARHRQDLAYLSVHRELERRFSNYRYLALTTREPENLDPHVPGYVGKQHLQDYFASGQFERKSGLTLDPQRTHVFLCGNPDMVGLPTHDDRRKPAMVEILAWRGFQLDGADQPGTVHCESYW